MKNIVYDLSKLTEKFFEMKQLEKHDYWKSYFHLSELLEKGLDKQFESKYAFAEDKILSPKLHNEERYFKINHLKWLENDFKTVFRSKRILNEPPQELAEFAVYEFLVTIFKYYNNISAFKNNLNKTLNADIGLHLIESLNLEMFLEYVRKHSPMEFKILNVYYRMYKALSQPDEINSYYQFKKELSENINLFDDDEKRNMYVCLGNTLLGNKDIRNLNINTEYTWINKTSDKENVFTNSYGKVDLIKYSNSVSEAGFAFDHEFIELLKAKYLNKLNTLSLSGMELYTEIFLSYAKNNFAVALEQSSKANFEIPVLKFNIKSMQARILYEFSDYDSFEYFLDTYRHFLTNSKQIPEIHINKYKKFGSYLNILFRLKIQNRSDETMDKLKLLEQEILADEFVSRHWLLEKVDELMKSCDNS